MQSASSVISARTYRVYLPVKAKQTPQNSSTQSLACRSIRCINVRLTNKTSFLSSSQYSSSNNESLFLSSSPGWHKNMSPVTRYAGTKGCWPCRMQRRLPAVAQCSLNESHTVASHLNPTSCSPEGSWDFYPLSSLQAGIMTIPPPSYPILQPWMMMLCFSFLPCTNT